MSLLATRWPTDALWKLVNTFQVDDDQVNCTCIDPQNCSKTDLNKLACDIVPLNQVELQEQFQEQFPSLIDRLQQIINRVSCQKARTCYKQKLNTFTYNPHNVSSALCYFLSPSWPLDEHRLESQEVRDAQKTELDKIREKYVEASGSILVDAERLEYTMRWSPTEVLVVECALKTAPSRAPSIHIPTELYLLRYNSLLKKLYDRGPEADSCEPSVMSVAAAAAAVQMTVGSAPTAAAAAVAGLIAGLAYWCLRDKWGMYRSQPKDTTFIELTPHLAIGFDKRSSGPGNRMLLQRSHTWGYLRFIGDLNDPANSTWYFEFNYHSAIQPQQPMDPEALFFLREQMLMQFCKGTLTLEELVSMHTILKKPLEGCVNEAKGLTDQWTSIIFESLFPLCVHTLIQQKGPKIAEIIELCRTNVNRRATLKLADFLPKEEVKEVDDSFGIGPLVVVS